MSAAHVITVVKRWHQNYVTTNLHYNAVNYRLA